MASRPHLVVSWGGVTENDEKDKVKNENKAVFSEFEYDGNHPNWITGIHIFTCIYIYIYMYMYIYEYMSLHFFTYIHIIV
jgi:hypothetical protein